MGKYYWIVSNNGNTCGVFDSYESAIEAKSHMKKERPLAYNDQNVLIRPTKMNLLDVLGMDIKTF